MAGVSQLMMPSSTSVPIIIVVRLLPVEPIMTLVSGVHGRTRDRIGDAKALAIDQLAILHDADDGARNAERFQIGCDELLQRRDDLRIDRQRLDLAQVRLLDGQDLEAGTDDGDLGIALLQAGKLPVDQDQVGVAVLAPAPPPARCDCRRPCRRW